MKHDGSMTAPAEADRLFGPRIDKAARYVDMLATVGVQRGLIGPREADRLWHRHILNSAAVAELLPANARVADIGSGAGLPGIPLAIARPDLEMVLVEPLLRRATFLGEAVIALDLPGVTVVRARAEDRDAPRGDCDAVLSRALAALDKVARWSVPLLRPGGEMVAIKGERAESELEEHRNAIAAAGLTEARVVTCGESYGIAPTTVVVARRADEVSRRTRRGRK